MQTAPGTTPASAKILIVEDEGLIARDLESRVRKAGYQVAGVVDTGEAAIQKVAESNPDLILMDIFLRGRLDGIETARQVRTNHDLPIIYLTAHTDRETLNRAKTTEPFGYLAKPIGQASLPTSIEVALYKHKVDRELRRQRAWLRTALRTMTDAVIVADNFGRVQYINPAAESLTRWSTSEVLDQPVVNVLKLLDSPSGQVVDDLLPGFMLDTNPSAFPAGLLLVTRDHERIAVEGEVAPSTDEGAPLGAVITFRDVTLKQREEQEVRHDHKMQAVGRLAAGVAHDFNNLLTVILGHASLLLGGESNLDGRVRHALDEIRRAGTTAADVTRQLLAFSRNHSPQPEPVNLTSLIQENEELFRRSIPAGIRFEVQSSADLNSVYADRGQIAQILLNLIINAGEAMPAGGSLTVTTENVEIADSDDPSAKAEEYVALTVTDTGIGMEPSVADHIFEPFFTTKRAGHGTGLGLAIVHSIVKDIGGVISVESEPGQGTTFRAFLPVAEDAPVRPAQDARSASKAGDRPKTVLLADDNEDVRSVMRQFLESHGYHVLEAADGVQALSIAIEDRGRIDVLVTDVVMPKMDGFRLAHQLTQLRPELKTIFVSGYSGGVEQEDKALPIGGRILHKPFVHRDLLAQVEQLVGGSAAAPTPKVKTAKS